jgi:hypothetical protein
MNSFTQSPSGATGGGFEYIFSKFKDWLAEPENSISLIEHWRTDPATDPLVANLFWTLDGALRCARCRRTLNVIGAAALLLPINTSRPLCWYGVCLRCARWAGNSESRKAEIGEKVRLLLDELRR